MVEIMVLPIVLMIAAPQTGALRILIVAVLVEVVLVEEEAQIRGDNFAFAAPVLVPNIF